MLPRTAVCSSEIPYLTQFQEVTCPLRLFHAGCLATDIGENMQYNIIVLNVECLTCTASYFSLCYIIQNILYTNYHQNGVMTLLTLCDLGDMISR